MTLEKFFQKRKIIMLIFLKYNMISNPEIGIYQKSV